MGTQPCPECGESNPDWAQHCGHLYPELANPRPLSGNTVAILVALFVVALAAVLLLRLAGVI